MKPIEELEGVELDCAVAAEVVGWQVLPNRLHGVPLGIPPYEAQDGKFKALPAYSREIAAAWQVVEWINEPSKSDDDSWFKQDVQNAFYELLRHEASKHRSCPLVWLLEAADAPKEICRAAIAAVRFAKAKQTESA